MPSTSRPLGPLEATVVAPSTPPSGAVCVLLHGFGAPGTDLVPLSQVLRAPAGTTFVFPRAPLDLGAAFAGGRAWWMIDIAALQTAMASGRHRDLAGSEPDGLDEARAKLAACLDAIDAELEPTRLVLGGFSQGSMLATDYALSSDRRLEGLILFSGTLLAEPRWTGAAAARSGLPVVQSHGRSDPVLPYAGAERLRDVLVSGGLPVDFVPFAGGHEIPLPAVERASGLLSRVLAPD